MGALLIILAVIVDCSSALAGIGGPASLRHGEIGFGLQPTIARGPSCLPWLRARRWDELLWLDLYLLCAHFCVIARLCLTFMRWLTDQHHKSECKLCQA